MENTNQIEDSVIRSILKSISFRILATIVTVFLVYFYTGSYTLSLGIGLWEVITKLILYYAHERAWNKIQWGHTFPGLARHLSIFLSLFLRR